MCTDNELVDTEIWTWQKKLIIADRKNIGVSGIGHAPLNVPQKERKKQIENPL